MTTKITSDIGQLVINRAESLKLELHLNKSLYGHSWSKIGDQLYNFHIGNEIEEIKVTEEQYKFLNNYIQGQPE